MEQKNLMRGCAIALACLLVTVTGLYWIAGDAFRTRSSQTEMLSPQGTLQLGGMDGVLEQPFSTNGDRLTGVTLYCGAQSPESDGQLLVEVYGDGALLESQTLALYGRSSGESVCVPCSAALTGAKSLLLRITPLNEGGTAALLYYGDSINAGRFRLSASLSSGDYAVLNGTPVAGALCYEISTDRTLWLGRYYWAMAAAVMALGVGIAAWLLYANGRKKESRLLALLVSFGRYRFLMKQLVIRDFKTKYKRSVLGVLWSFLNPLLTMSVQYVVFSTLFRSNIPNFALYLMVGIVCFSFFSESTSMTLTSILNNAPLITKVYMPKYVYPVTRVVSSTINFLLALIPIFAVMALTGAPFRPAILLLPLPIMCLFALCLGVGMLLATSMVFFRDTLFLWNVVSMLWMYLTPVFYPETILPQRFQFVFQCNPLYHIIRFIRTILMEGVSPDPMAYGMMLLTALIPLCIGICVFRWKQDEFALNL